MQAVSGKVVSVVVPTYRRPGQLRVCLEALAKQTLPGSWEVIVVDDGSSSDHIIQSHHLKRFSFSIKVIRVDPGSKTWINPVIPFNLGISHARGEWIILQNPEVCHVGDVCAYVAKADPRLYHVMRVWAMNKNSSIKDYRGVIIGKHGNPYKLAIARCTPKRWKGRWYSTPKSPRRAYHFCVAIHRTALNRIGGFNPAMAKGIWYDDDEFLLRVRRVARVVFVGAPVMGVHQWHPSFSFKGRKVTRASHKGLKSINVAVLNATRRNPKKIHCDISQGLPLPTTFTVTSQP